MAFAILLLMIFDYISMCLYFLPNSDLRESLLANFMPSAKHSVSACRIELNKLPFNETYFSFLLNKENEKELEPEKQMRKRERECSFKM